MIEAAMDIAYAVHEHQRYGDRAYVTHVELVVWLTKAAFSAQPDNSWVDMAVAVAYLHDTIEDSSEDAREAVKGDIARRCGDDVLRLVLLLTDPAEGNRKARKAASHAKLAAVDRSTIDSVALVVKVADRLANVTNCLVSGPGQTGLARMYDGEQRAFEQAVRCAMTEPLLRQIRATLAFALGRLPAQEG